MDVPRLAQTNTVENLGYLTETAFRYSDNRGATNVFECAKNILSTPCTVGEACAYSVFTEKVVPCKEKDRLVQQVIQYLARPGVVQSVHNACVRVAGGKGSSDFNWLYTWCHNHENEVLEFANFSKLTN